MSLWDVAGATIARAFADPERLVYRQDGVDLPALRAVRSERAAPSFDGSSASLRTIAYEIQQSDLPARPTKKDSFTHRGRRWRIENIDRLDDVSAWELIVCDDGPAA